MPVVSESKTALDQTVEALAKNGISATVVSKDDAKSEVLKLIPKGSEVMTMTSVTLDELGIAQEINESGNYKSVRALIYGGELDDESQKRKLGAGPDFALGSVNAVTQDGKVLLGSNTGSQLAAYVYGAGKVVWVVGTQKIVKDVDAGIKRIEEHVVPLEDNRAQKAYGTHTFLSKLLIINKEVKPGRLHIVFVEGHLGF